MAARKRARRTDTQGISPTLRRGACAECPGAPLRVRGRFSHAARCAWCSADGHPSTRALDTSEQRARDVATPVIAHDVQLVSPRRDGRGIRETRLTFLNPIVGLHCLESPSPAFVDSHMERAVKVDCARIGEEVQAAEFVIAALNGRVIEHFQD